MKNIFQSVIKQGGYNLPDMLHKIDQYHVAGKLTDQERDELYAQARGSADPTGNLDVLAKLMELEDRVRKLESSDAPVQDDYPEYVVGKWYYAGDKISYGGKNYVCSAPEGAVCTWNPDEYPAYWSVEE